MPRTILIRILAACIYALRANALKRSTVRFLVFTGTSGKTLARSVTAYALRAQGHRVISPPFGYTNELGIVLAALGIESTHLLSPRGIWQILTSRAPQGAYICIELGADWRTDIGWFLKRFRPYGVFITNVSSQEWTRTLKDIWIDKQLLCAAVIEDGFILWSGCNESIGTIRTISLAKPGVRTQEVNSVPALDYAGITYKKMAYDTRLARYLPYIESFGLAIAAVELIDGRVPSEQKFFSRYEAPQGRLQETHLLSGATLLHDTYKCIPQCLSFVLDAALSLPARQRIAIVSAMHPLTRQPEHHYGEIAKRLRQFESVYFIGPPDLRIYIQKLLPEAQLISEGDYAQIAQRLQSQADADSVIVVKGSKRYRLDRLVSLLTASVSTDYMPICRKQFG